MQWWRRVRSWNMHRWSVTGRLVVLPSVALVAAVYSIVILWLVYRNGGTLRAVPIHFVDVVVKGFLGLLIPLILLFNWRRSKPPQRVLHVFDWFGAGLFSLSFTLIASMPDEIFQLNTPGPIFDFMASSGWGLWAGGAVVLLTVGTATLTEDLNTERIERERLQALIEFTTTITRFDFQATLDEAIRHLTKLLRAEGCVLYLWSEEHNALVPRAGWYNPRWYSPVYISRMMAFKCPLGFGMTGWVMQTGEPCISGNVMEDPRSQAVPGWKVNLKSSLVVPMQVEGRRLGVVRLSRRGLHQFTRDDLDLVMGFMTQAALVIEQGRIVNEMREQIVTDSLTGLFNESHFHSVLPSAIERAHSLGSPLTLMVVEYVPFKRLHDLLGWGSSDRGIELLARALKAIIRPSEYAFRYAGGQFLLLLPDVDEESAKARQELLREAIAEADDGSDISGNVRLGLAVLPTHAYNTDTLLMAAQRSLETHGAPLGSDAL